MCNHPGTSFVNRGSFYIRKWPERPLLEIANVCMRVGVPQLRELLSNYPMRFKTFLSSHDPFEGKFSLIFP